ncbi:MAG: RNA 2',3'-cyclic phosphodiesterase [Candidatus Aenigmatarchaeota archaeon]|nr:MAG: RNA 2',3'-cyclic phosphodiesterase [Candidatus Aenigmarchaeota archaeon]
MPRLFFAIDLPNNLRERIIEIQKEIALPNVKLVEPENLHITLLFLGNREDVDYIVSKASTVKFEPFTYRIAGVHVFPNLNFMRSIVFKVQPRAPFANLHKQLKKLLDVGSDNYEPHITLGRVRYRSNEDKLISFITKYSSYVSQECEAKAFKLKKSILRREGPIYIDIGEFK